MAIKGCTHLVEGVAEDLVVPVEVGAHGRVLGSLAGENEDGFALMSQVVLGEAGMVAAGA